MPRYAVLFHEVAGSARVAAAAGTNRGDHWDWMFEHNGVLKCWAVESPPRHGLSASAIQLPDHRLAYLDYEGPISGNRGSVRRHLRGEFEWRLQSSDRFEIKFATGWRGKMSIELQPDGKWILNHVSPPEPESKTA